jgi:lysozyme
MRIPSRHLLDDLRRDEGLRLKAYPDPLTGAAPWTIGYGHTGPEVKLGLVWTIGDAEKALFDDAVTALTEAAALTGGIDDPVRRDAVAEMVFNLGAQRLLRFRHMLAAIRVGDWERAAEEAADSDWAREVGERANRIVYMLRAGRRAA